jgi:hypothetical protein
VVLRKLPAWVGIISVAAAVGAIALLLWVFRDSGSVTLPAADTPPAEYLYLDNERVLTYLGQLVGGLAPSETQSESLTEALTAGLKGGELADLSGSRTHAESVLRVVSPSASDRFYRLLATLRTERSERPWEESETHPDRSSRWLHTLDGHVSSEDSLRRFLDEIGRVHEGDFVRIAGAHLFLPPFASFFRKTRYAAWWTPPGTVIPRHPPFLLSVQGGEAPVARYRSLLGPDVTLPFVIPITVAEYKKTRVTVFVPARYTRLADNARLLAGNLTVVGKVIYKDPRLPGAGSCKRLVPDPARVPNPCRYVDRQTISSYTAALVSGPPAIRSILGFADLPRYRVRQSVRRFVRFVAPVLVVLPIAIYQ